jgi:hypothetical protein
MKKPKYHTGTPLVLEFAPQYTIGTSPVPLPPVEDSDHKPLIGLQQEVHYEKKFNWTEITFPEFGPARYYEQEPKQLVIALGGRNYIVKVDLDIEDGGHPIGGRVTFTPTDAPETPYSLTERRRDLTVFGQPRFKQWPVTPSFNGKCACILAVLETGWGDAGNANVFCILNDEGIPTHVWMEASCS